jgi:hypothetical protein
MLNRIVHFLAVMVVSVSVCPALGQTAGMLSFQGLLKDPNGQPVNGPVTLQFRIYDAQTGGNLVDMDGSGAVDPNVGKDVKEVSTTATSGIVSTKFGPVCAKAFDGNPRWLEVSVNGTTLSRKEIPTAPATSEQVNRPGAGDSVIGVSPNGDVLLTYGGDRYDAGPVMGFAATHEAQPGAAIRSNLKQMGDGVEASTMSFLTRGDPRWPLAVRLTVGAGLITLYEGIGLGNRPENEPGAYLHTILKSVGGGKEASYMSFRTRGDPSWGIGERMRIDCDYIHLYEKAHFDQEAFFDRKATMPVLEITGGSDLAEPFKVSSCQQSAISSQRQRSPDDSTPARAEPGAQATGLKIEPGMVVVIDPDNPGQLRLATEPYDRKVAGIISGANGLKPGMVMSGLQAEAVESHHKGTKTQSLVLSCPGGEGVHPKPETRTSKPDSSAEHPVALTGRVWCWCDAKYGPIAPGDRLTTSGTPGHAMKVTEETRAGGAVIGKAMTKLETGKGLVLVLVQPQ